MPNPYPGTGADGAIVFDGSHSVAHATRSGFVYSLTGDVNATSIKVLSGVIVQTCNYRLFCSGTVTVDGWVHNNGGDGANGGDASPVGAAGGYNTTNSGSGGTLLASAPGQASSGTAGGTEAQPTASDSAAGTGTSTPNVSPNTGNGGSGANACAGSFETGGAGGSGAQGGGAGGGYSARNAFDVGPVGGAGGGAGGYAGTVWISGSTIFITASGRITANGGNGGNGGKGHDSTGSNTPGAGAGGGGSSGNGGKILLYCDTFVNNGTLEAKAGIPGIGGAPGSAAPACGAQGTAGANGTAGTDGIVPPAGGFTIIGHGCNCNDYDNGGFLSPLWPPGVGVLVDDGDLDSIRDWCGAMGLGISFAQDSQRTAKDFLDELTTVANHFVVYSGAKAKLICYDEVSKVGNGRIYNAWTSRGPVFDWDDRDFKLFEADTSPDSFDRKRRAGCDNVVSIQHMDRANDYQTNVTSDLDAKAVALEGPRKGGTLDSAELGVNLPSGSKTFMSITKASDAQIICSILAKRSAAGKNQHTLKVGHEKMNREAGDLGLITSKRLGVVKMPVRIISVRETLGEEEDLLGKQGNSDDFSLEVVVEEFEYGLNHPDVRSTTQANGNLVNANVDPGLVNEPVIYEPTTGMMPAGSPRQIWFEASGSDPNYGGCAVYVSLDGPSGPYSTSPIGTMGPCKTGFLMADYPDSSADPDTTDSLQADLTESRGAISSQTQAQADAFTLRCFISSTSSYGAPYEVISYTDVTPEAAYQFLLDTYIRRAIQGTPHLDHPNGARFAVIDGQVLKVNLPNEWLGKELWFKFPAVNKLGSQQNSLADCVAYPYTPLGTNAVVSVDGVAVSFDDEILVDGVEITSSAPITIDGV